DHPHLGWKRKTIAEAAPEFQPVPATCPLGTDNTFQGGPIPDIYDSLSQVFRQRSLSSGRTMGIRLTVGGDALNKTKRRVAIRRRILPSIQPSGAALEVTATMGILQRFRVGYASCSCI